MVAMEAHELNVIPGPQALPTIDAEPCERADAARNRRRILAAAARLIEERGVEHVSMDAIAADAGVGKGTLFRRFGDRSGLVMALLDERTREFQDRLIRGEPPLGPGAPPAERIIAFGRGMLALLEAHGEMLLAAELGARWVRGEAGVYALYRTHLAMLVRECSPELDDEYLAEALLAPLGPETFLYLRKGRSLPLERIEAGYEQLVRRLLTPA
jgi:AcrR family transcriptional regulator